MIVPRESRWFDKLDGMTLIFSGGEGWWLEEGGIDIRSIDEMIRIYDGDFGTRLVRIYIFKNYIKLL